MRVGKEARLLKEIWMGQKGYNINGGITMWVEKEKKTEGGLGKEGKR